MTLRHLVSVSAIAALGLSLSACSSTGKALGLKSNAPNEFNILTKAPLIVPPEYNLRPPRAGESSTENNYSQQAAREALIGDIDDAAPSQGEIVLLAKAGAPRANPEIRLEIDGENSVERKTEGFTDRVLFWQDGKAYSKAGVPLDPEAEERRLKAITATTGGGEVEISRRPGGAKLPGL